MPGASLTAYATHVLTFCRLPRTRPTRGAILTRLARPKTRPLTGADRGNKLVSNLVIMEEPAMPNWPVQDAKARFSEFLDACVSEGPQVVTRRGVETAVMVPIEEWRRLRAAARPSLKQLLLVDTARTDTLVPGRGKARRRRPAVLS